MSEFTVEEWYGAFVSWMAARVPETIGVLSDCAGELYLNALTAHHLRLYGIERNIPMLWARCEWEKTDISVGLAKERFSSGQWDSAWWEHKTGDIAVIEAKLIYWHYPSSKCRDILKTLQRELQARKFRYDKEAPQRYLGLVWLITFASVGELNHMDKLEKKWTLREGDDGWEPLFEQHRLASSITPSPLLDRHRGSFYLVGRWNLSDYWPTADQSIGSLYLTMRELRQ